MERPAPSPVWCCVKTSGETSFCPWSQASPEILLDSYHMTFITAQTPFCFSYKEAQSQNSNPL